jgi:uncharacterized protein (TIGR02679 family)
LRELRDHPVPLADGIVHACENPQVLQACADAGGTSPIACLAGNPSAAGLLLVTRAEVRYHGDFDWPGVAIARRVYAAGASPWRMSAADYRSAAAANRGLALTGRPELTPWDPALADAMTELGMAVHEEALLDTLLADLLP